MNGSIVMPTPTYKPKANDRKLIRQLSGLGIRQEDIAAEIGISVDTLTKYHQDDLDKGKTKAIAAVAEKLYQSAMDGNFPAQQFYLRTRGQGMWNDKQQVEVSGTGTGQLVILTGIDLAKPVEHEPEVIEHQAESQQGSGDGEEGKG